MYLTKCNYRCKGKMVLFIVKWLYMYVRKKTSSFFIFLLLHLLYLQREFKKNLETSFNFTPNPSYLHIHMQNELKNVITIRIPPEIKKKIMKQTCCYSSNPLGLLQYQWGKLCFFLRLLNSSLLVCYIGSPKHRRDNSSQRNWAERRYWSLLEFRLPKRYVLYLSSLD